MEERERKVVLEIIAEQIGCAVEDLPDESSLQTLGLDTLDRVEIANELEEQLEIELPEEEDGRWQSVDDILQSARAALAIQRQRVSAQ